MNSALQKKYSEIRQEFQTKKHIGIAYSAGVDSTLLLNIAKTIPSTKVTAITIVSEFYPSWELTLATSTTKELNIHHKVIKFEPLANPDIVANHPDRCYACKKSGFGLLKNYCIDQNIEYICDGSCTDDLGDYRPGYTAIKELRVSSPFIDFGFSKNDIIELSKELKVDGWDRPSCACLASRIPYEQQITAESLLTIDKAETFLHTLNLPEARVRLHEKLARIEVSESNLNIAFKARKEITSFLKELGISYISLDLEGYITGNLNKTLKDSDKR